MPTSPRAFVIGHPVAHSRSPMIHGTWLREHGLAGTYEKIDIPPGDIPAFMRDLGAAGFAGGNVTVPHKTAVMPFVDRLDAAARAIGAVNTLWFEGDALIGGNTDAAGFVQNLDDEAPGWDAGGRHAVVLGAGGAARAIVHGLLGRGCTIAIVNRTLATATSLAADFGPRVSAHEWDDFSRQIPVVDLLVNTTALGMMGKPPLVIDLAGLARGAVVCDIVYVPLETDLLRAATARGHRVVGGLGMLLHQAVPGFARWFGVTPAVTPALRRLVEDDVRKATG